MKTKSNKIKDIEEYIFNELKNKYSQNEIHAFVNILFKEYANINSAYLLAFKEDYVNESELLNIVLATEKLKKQEPIQHILGYTEFLNLKIKVTSDVLIPRPETEELVQMIISENKQNNLNIIDLCTGSGCIALALNKYIKNACVMGIDISENALKIAKENNNNLHLNTEFYQADILNINSTKINCHFSKLKCHFAETFSEKNFIERHFNLANNLLEEKQFDIIVSNPPYVMEKDKADMENNVLKYEPSLALFVKDENPLIFYEKIANFAQKNLKIGGKIYLEINNSLAKQTLALFSQKEYIAEIRTDIFGRERFIFLQKNH